MHELFMIHESFSKYILLDFGYDWYFMRNLFKFHHEKKTGHKYLSYLKTKHSDKKYAYQTHDQIFNRD